MKFTVLPVAALAFLVSTVVAQTNSTNGETCEECLQSSLLSLPLCKGLNITIGDFNPGESPAFVVCLCSSMNGTWIDACQATTLCGPDILQFKASYQSDMEQAGLQCNGTTPTFNPGPTATVDPTTPLGSNPTSTAGSSGGKTSSGVKDAVPSAMFKEVMGVVAIVMAIGASLI
ncbi:hypothetical protein BGZ80_006048 [Entomortierella chlamydospora]|uniref:Extracellular membrane protein CFEM domain-containing protein n=1 Tax=Entomortierella chlamydospora TaxID=101097 RepID=A0A9P6MZ21_9FUNG|nr:hypothetical protein BGZ79_007894 [Entomortierella chlamydospora]KAG0019268.1 hypothetical protein BGZ80_006048 [Entomortierella chlamydospora]